MKITRDIELHLDKIEILCDAKIVIVKTNFEFCGEKVTKREQLEFDEKIALLCEELKEWIANKIQ